MEFSDFCSHYLHMTDEQIVKDVRDSMRDLIAVNSDGDSFGARMVKKAKEMAERKAATYRNNANARWHPEQQGGGTYGPSVGFPTVTEIYDFASEKNLDSGYAREFYELNFVERGGKDKDGNVITNWKGMMLRYCESRARKGN